jgi:hypothetical protein
VLAASRRRIVFVLIVEASIGPLNVTVTGTPRLTPKAPTSGLTEATPKKTGPNPVA